MSILLVQVPVSALSIDEVKCPDRDKSQILDHLVRYFAKFDPLPAITVALSEEGVATVVRGHNYLLAARILARATVRAVVASPPHSSEIVKRFLARADVTPLDWEAIKAGEDQNPRPRGWHVFFFERPLSVEEKQAFDNAARELFAEPNLQVLHDDSGPAAEFEASTPVTEPTWARRHLDVFAGFARDYVPIVSYQGRRFTALWSAPSAPA